MANGKFNLGKQSGGVLSLTFPDGATDTEVMLPESGELVNSEELTMALNTKVTKITSTDNAIVRFNGTEGEVQNTGSYITDTGNMLINTTTDNGVDKLQVNGSISNVSLHYTISNESANTGEYTKTATDGSGTSIFASVFGDIPTVGELYAEEIGASNYLIASVYKRGVAYAPSVTIQAFNGLGLVATNAQGTIALNGFTNTNNVRMMAKIRKIY